MNSCLQPLKTGGRQGHDQPTHDAELSQSAYLHLFQPAAAKWLAYSRISNRNFHFHASLAAQVHRFCRV